MQIVALDGTKLIVLMLAGGAFALAGLWLMFRPQPEGEAARIELFGLKFQASSAGLLVFLIGAAFLSVPIFVPERPAADRRAGAAAGGAGHADASRTMPPGERRPGQIAIEAAEAEPNDTIASANLVSLGSVIRGELSRGDVDFFAVDVPEGVRGDIVASIHVSETRANLELMDDAGTPLVRREAGVGYHTSSNSVERSTQRPRYFIAARNLLRDPGRYTLTVAVREP
jgi:hypothetical protein